MKWAPGSAKGAIDRANDTLSVDDEPAGHRQGPALLAVANGEIITEAQINLLQIVRQLEPNPELFRILVAPVGQQIEADFMLVDQRPARLRRLRRNRADRGSQFL